MKSRRVISRRNVVHLLCIGPPVVRASYLVRSLTMLAGFATTKYAQAREEGPEILVQLSSPKPEVVRAFIRAYALEVVRATGPGAPGEATVVIVVMRSSVLGKAARTAGLTAELLAGPPSADQIPQVGRGNRFKDPRVLPVGRGMLLKGRP